MRRSSLITMQSAVLLLGLLNLACPSSKSGDSELHPIGPEVRADLLIYFKTGITQQEINSFSKEILSQADPRGRGDYLPPGVQTFLRIYPPVQGHEGIAITFFPNATDDQRQNLKKAVETSPVVYKVLENISPADVKNLK